MEEPRRSFADGLYGAELERQIDEAAAAIRSRLSATPELSAPRLAIILGSGLGGVVDLLDPAPRLVIPFGEIPHVPVATVPIPRSVKTRSTYSRANPSRSRTGAASATRASASPLQRRPRKPRGSNA